MTKTYEPENSKAFARVRLDRIARDGNRKHGKDEGFEQLVNSIREHGIIEPPVLRFMSGCQDADFRAVAGRRRIEAARQLGLAEIECAVLAEDDPRGDEEIALSENVNRLEMHPLDEAALFARMAERGAAVAEIARYYARSPSAIYKRLRLASLTDELKGMFRNGAISIASAAVLAELPGEDQEAFWRQYEARSESWREEIPASAVTGFVNKRQRFTITAKMEEGCTGCAKRTHNSGNELFDEFAYMDDVCLDGECYREKWREAVNTALEEKVAEHGPGRTDKKIFFANGIPKLLYGKDAHVNFSNDEGLNVEYEVLKEKECEFSGETNRKKGACWMIKDGYSRTGALLVQRVGYKPKEKREAGAEKAKNDPDKQEVKRYGEEALEAAAAERGTTPVELARELKDKRVEGYEFTNEISGIVYERVVSRRIAAEKSGAEPPRDYFSMFLRLADENLYGSGAFIEEQFDAGQRQRYGDLVGAKSLKQMALGFDDKTQMLFHFLLLSFGFENDVPDLDDLKDAKGLSENIFWEYAGMGADEYRALYIEAAKEAAAKALAPKPKKGGKKKAAAKEADAEDTERIKVGERENVRTCRACGCTCDDDRVECGRVGGGCYWVDDDLCGACAEAAAEEDGYPFEPDPVTGTEDGE